MGQNMAQVRCQTHYGTGKGGGGGKVDKKKTGGGGGGSVEREKTREEGVWGMEREKTRGGLWGVEGGRPGGGAVNRGWWKVVSPGAGDLLGVKGSG